MNNLVSFMEVSEAEWSVEQDAYTELDVSDAYLKQIRKLVGAAYNANGGGTSSDAMKALNLVAQTGSLEAGSSEQTYTFGGFKLTRINSQLTRKGAVVEIKWGDDYGYYRVDSA